MTDVGDYADDPPPPIRRDHLSQRVLARPERPRQRLVDHHDAFAGRAIPLRESSTQPQRNSCRLEITVAHNANEWLRRRVALPVNLSYGRDSPRPVVAQRQHVGNSSRHNAGDRPGPAQHIVDKGVLLGETRDPKTRVDPQRSRALRLKSQIHVEDAEKAPNQQPRADQQHTGEGEFGNHQPIADPGMPLAAARTAAAILHGLHEERAP